MPDLRTVPSGDTPADVLAAEVSRLRRDLDDLAATVLARTSQPSTEWVVPSLKVTGIAGSASQVRIIGSNAAGAPTTGAHAVDDVAFDAAGKIWICTVAGTPGTWVEAGGPAFIGARVYRAAVQNLLNTTSTAIGFDTESFDTGAMHDNATNNTRVLLNQVGKWLVLGQLVFAANVTGARQAQINVNGGYTAYHLAAPVPGGTLPTTVQVAAIVNATAITDYVEMIGYQASGGTLAVGPGGASDTWFSTAYLGA